MKLWKLLPLGMAFIFSSSTLCAQIKPTAMLLPIYFVDLDKKSLQGSLNNFVKTELSDYYDLKSEKEVEQARDAAVDQISSENCTEEACVKVMGELLDVEYTFSLEIIDTGEGWDLSVVRQDMDGVTSRRNELCNECSLSKARKSLAGILTALRPGEMLIQRGKASLRLESTPRSQVFLDGREQGKTPLDLSVNARVPLEIFMVAEGYNDFAEEFTLKPGEKRKKHAKLTRKRGNIRITSNPPKASIYVDGILEMDDQGKALLAPADLRLVYGQYELVLKLKKYEDSTETLRINKKNFGTKNIILIPKPGRLIVRVPSEHKEASISQDGDFLGRMNGKIVKNFEVPANIRLTLQAEDGNFKSETKTIRIEPDGSERVEFEDFTETKSGSDWFSNIPSIFFFNTNPSATFKGSSGKDVELSYSLMGIGLHWGRLRIETTNRGNGSIKDEGKSADYFYFSDGTNIHRVDSTSASIWRIMYGNEATGGWREKIWMTRKKGEVFSWVYGIGYESVTLILLTQDDGERKIKMKNPVVDFGLQWNWPHVYLVTKYGFALTEEVTNFSYNEGFSVGIGFIW